MARTPWLESACGSRRKDKDVGRWQGELSSPPRQGDARSPAGASPGAIAEGHYTRLTRIGLLLLGLILLGLFACPPRTYAWLAHETWDSSPYPLFGFPHR